MVGLFIGVLIEALFFFFPNNFTDTFYMHGNHFTGEFPDEACRSCPQCDDGPFVAWAMDCQEIPCTKKCCDFVTNCFYPNDEKDPAAYKYVL